MYTSRELLAGLVESLQISSGDIFDGAPAADAIVSLAFTFSARLVCSHSVTQGVSSEQLWFHGWRYRHGVLSALWMATVSCLRSRDSILYTTCTLPFCMQSRTVASSLEEGLQWRAACGMTESYY